jgi:hypothetical protein
MSDETRVEGLAPCLRVCDRKLNNAAGGSWAATRALIPTDEGGKAAAGVTGIRPGTHVPALLCRRHTRRRRAPDALTPR